MATVTNWNPYGVALNVTATAGTVTRTSATQYTVTLNVSWKCYWSGNSTNYGMSATSGGVTKTISAFGTSRGSGSASFTGTYSISGAGKQTKSITVTFKNFNTDKNQSASKNVTLSVSVPAWTTYAVKYNGNATGVSNLPSAQTKVKGATLKLSSTKPTRTGYTFQGWGTVSGDTSVDYAAGANYTTDAAVTLYAVWKANTYSIKFDANNGSGAPSAVTKTYGVDLTLPNTKPTRSGYTFLGWGLSASDATATYQPGGKYAKNSAATLYAVWDLGYWAPKVTNLSVERCDESGNPTGDGAYFKLKFRWECCQALGDNGVSSIAVSWGTGSTTLAPNGTYSGDQEHVLGGDLSPNASYEIVVTVADASGSTPATTRLSSCAYTVDFKAGGKGVAFGKEAEMDGFDVDMDAVFRKNVSMGSTNGTTDFKGKTIRFWSGEAGLTDRAYGVNKVLWSGIYNMNGDQTITLSEAVTAQPNGIILCFSYYDANGVAQNYNWNYFFVPKYHVAQNPGTGVNCMIANNTFSVITNKYLYVNNTTITGTANNVATGTNNGVTYANNRYVLRRVIGV